ncbi:hypothetical protein [Flavobacterium subsaxonicum]|uniref:Uncharacterized protein n=1 Tax=Flavobacterium subsaxonicum WB 4.1-42 = DSM 21790 TaxID=1121898 RepID=A0A0A2MN48_9FLAO|nr:hypothetical protein [Flavobacterium subsaxonicum]KGO93729.1 hypothetical protein Q766_07170 [Flavobacterium subsaxonicum WB 4.1-42 = DSM 21790]
MDNHKMAVFISICFICRVYINRQINIITVSVTTIARAKSRKVEYKNSAMMFPVNASSMPMVPTFKNNLNTTTGCFINNSISSFTSSILLFILDY